MVCKKTLQIEGEQALRSIGLGPVETRTLVKDRDIGQPDATIHRRIPDSLEHDIVILIAAGLTVQVMKLGHARVTTANHLDIGLPCNRPQSIRAHRSGKLVHAFAPGPEVVLPRRRALLRTAGQRPLKGMAVCIAKPGNQALGQDIVSIRTCVAHDRLNSPRHHRQADVVGPAAG